jgi:purine-binding chemotaxis protein CheW
MRGILVFAIERQKFGLYLDDVVEILPALEPTPLPKAPGIVEGAIDFRGTIVPVCNVRMRFGLPDRGISVSDHLIVAVARSRRIALRVDHVLKIGRLPLAAIADIESVTAGSAYFSGVTRIDDDLIFIHDLGRFLSEAEAASLAELEAAAAT